MSSLCELEEIYKLEVVIYSYFFKKASSDLSSVTMLESSA